MARHIFDHPTQTTLNTAVPDSRIPGRLSAVHSLAVLLYPAHAQRALSGHTGSGLAIPDFPSAYGHLIPPLDRASLDAAVSRIPYDKVTGEYTPLQVGVQYAHRVWALAVVLVVLWVTTHVVLAYPNQSALIRPALALIGLLIFQVSLGAAVIWTGRHPEIATAHQAMGAATLATAVPVLTRRVGQRLMDAADSSWVSTPAAGRRIPTSNPMKNRCRHEPSPRSKPNNH